MISIEGQLVNDEVMGVPPAKILTDACLYDAPSRLLYGCLDALSPNANRTYPEYIAVESHITGARIIVKCSYLFTNGALYQPSHLSTPFEKFYLYSEREHMIKAFKDTFKG